MEPLWGCTHESRPAWELNMPSWLKPTSVITYQLIQLCSRKPWLRLNSADLNMKRIYFPPILAFNRALWNIPFLPLTTSRTSRKVRFLTFRFGNYYSCWVLQLRVKTWISFSTEMSFPLLPGQKWPGGLITEEPSSEMSLLLPSPKAAICRTGKWPGQGSLPLSVGCHFSLVNTVVLKMPSVWQLPKFSLPTLVHSIPWA